MKTIAIAFTLAAVAGSVHAAPVSATISAYNLSRIHEVAIGTVTSQVGETLNDFLLNGVRPVLRAFSDKTGFEGCGEIAYDAATKTYAVILRSSQSHLACATVHSLIPAGYTMLDITIHSHGTDKSFALNKSDRIFMGSDPDAVTMVFFNGQNVQHFSPTDFQGGPGFLATPTTVRYEDGNPKSECDIKDPTCKDHT